MRALVVYESEYGNTRLVAEAIGEGLRAVYDVTVVPVDDQAAALAADTDLLVVGGPTHVHGMSSQTTREAGTKDIAPDLLSAWTGAERGVREWLSGLPRVSGSAKRRAATFDTRMKGPRLIVGSASRPIARRLGGLGYELASKPESFTVDKGTGPLSDGELDRARAWGKSLTGLAP